ncbi:hypothetical protein [Caloramator sp. ALD01]|uniref:hypothetical protein n=1 Tax=Caloramator sp. ALD01 TaxID=1031288 RepID=UPI00041A222A|nr:hypothetical protein [Caloramator sp. ALD01]
MEIICLVGKSGTGKSYKAMQVASLYNIDCIIDDGLLIYKGRVVAGVSAKKEKTKMAAVKRAIFYEDEHRRQVKEKLNELNIDRILILATSLNMVEHITEALNLPNKYEVINIEDISTKEEIETARRQRLKEGKHVIPVPVFEIKRSFSGYFIDSIKNIIVRDNKKQNVEKTIVRPTFSYLGKFTVSETVIKNIISYIVERETDALKVDTIKLDNREEGIEVAIYVTVKGLCTLNQLAETIIKKIKEEFEYITGINIITIRFIYKDLKLR